MKKIELKVLETITLENFEAWKKENDEKHDLEMLMLREDISFDAISPCWIDEEPAWTLVAIQNGKVIFEVQKKSSEIKSAFYKETGRYSPEVVTQEVIENATRYFYLNQEASSNNSKDLKKD